jgi:bacterioferritin (cytochrome b1)
MEVKKDGEQAKGLCRLLVFQDFFDLTGGDFSQGDDDFPVVAIDQGLGALEKLPRPLGSKHHQLEAARDFFETIFNGNTRHIAILRSLAFTAPNSPDFPSLVNRRLEQSLTTSFSTLYIFSAREGKGAVLEVLKTIGRGFTSVFAGNGISQNPDPRDALLNSYRDLSNLARQISAHANKAPYPHVAAGLRRIAEEKQSSADLLREKILGFGSRPDEISREIKSGKNHWERLVEDLNDQTAVENRLLQRAALLNEISPETAELLRQIADSHRNHRKVLLDLIARADPQAEQT